MNLDKKSLNTEKITFSKKQIANNCTYFTIMYKKEPITLQIPNIKYKSIQNNLKIKYFYVEGSCFSSGV